MEPTRPEKGQGCWPGMVVIALVCSGLIGLVLVFYGGFVLLGLVAAAINGDFNNPSTGIALTGWLSNLVYGIAFAGFGIWCLVAVISSLRK